MFIEISKAGYFALGGINNPQLMKRALLNGRGEFLQDRYYFNRYYFKEDV